MPHDFHASLYLISFFWVNFVGGHSTLVFVTNWSLKFDLSLESHRISYLFQLSHSVTFSIQNLNGSDVDIQLIILTYLGTIWRYHSIAIFLFSFFFPSSSFSPRLFIFNLLPDKTFSSLLY